MAPRRDELEHGIDGVLVSGTRWTIRHCEITEPPTHPRRIDSRARLRAVRRSSPVRRDRSARRRFERAAAIGVEEASLADPLRRAVRPPHVQVAPRSRRAPHVGRSPPRSAERGVAAPSTTTGHRVPEDVARRRANDHRLKTRRRVGADTRRTCAVRAQQPCSSLCGRSSLSRAMARPSFVTTSVRTKTRGVEVPSPVTHALRRVRVNLRWRRGGGLSASRWITMVVGTSAARNTRARARRPA